MNERIDATVESSHKKSRSPWLVAVAAFGVGLLVAGGLGSAPSSSSSGASDASSATAARAAEVWTCSMHPEIRSSTPGQCPICGMDLVPVEGDDRGEAKRVRLSERARQLARIETSPAVVLADASRELNLIGRIDYDETTRRDITATAAGRVERLHVRETGAKVRRGQLIATIYSPEVYAAAREYVVAREQGRRMANAGVAAQQGASALLEAALERLQLLTVPQAEIDRLQAGGAAKAQIGVRSTTSGTIIERRVTEGMHVERGSLLYRLAGLSQLWLQLDAYERDLAVLRIDQPVEFHVDALADRTFTGRIAFIDPRVDTATRVARVRVQVDNSDGALRPGMVVDAIVRDQVAAGRDGGVLVIPATAPLHTGQRAVVYVEVDTEDGATYEARTVQLGPRVGDMVPVLHGLVADERVVTHGAFALDADLQIRGGESMMRHPDDLQRAAADASAEDAHSHHGHGHGHAPTATRPNGAVAESAATTTDAP